MVRQLRLNTLTTVGALGRSWNTGWPTAWPHGTVTGLRAALDASAAHGRASAGAMVHPRHQPHPVQLRPAGRRLSSGFDRYPALRLQPGRLRRPGRPGDARFPLANAAPAPSPSHRSALRPRRIEPLPDGRVPHMFGKPAQPNTNGNDPAHPGAMPAVPAQSLNTPPGLPQQKPGGSRRRRCEFRGRRLPTASPSTRARLQIRHEATTGRWQWATISSPASAGRPTLSWPRRRHLLPMHRAGLHWQPASHVLVFPVARPGAHGVSYGMNAITFRPRP